MRVVSGGTSSGLAVSKVVVLVAVLVGATSACVAVITVYIVRERCADPSYFSTGRAVVDRVGRAVAQGVFRHPWPAA